MHFDAGAVLVGTISHPSTEKKYVLWWCLQFLPYVKCFSKAGDYIVSAVTNVQFNKMQINSDERAIAYKQHDRGYGRHILHLASFKVFINTFHAFLHTSGSSFPLHTISHHSLCN